MTDSPDTPTVMVEADDRSLYPMTEPWTGRTPRRATDLTTERCPVPYARHLNAAWHSRLPRTQTGPWMYAFHAFFEGRTYAVALWHNPSARTLPGHWIELRRMAVAPDAPHCTASSFLARMVRWLKRSGRYERAISYQDCEVHTGTIYRAAGWTVGAVQTPRHRDRTGTRPGGRLYRTDLNGAAPAGAGKVRWECALVPSRD